MEQIKQKFNSIRFKLFISLCLSVVIVIIFFILLNNFVLETFYLYSKEQKLIETYNKINNYFNVDNNINLENELEQISMNNNFDILIKGYDGISIYTSNKNFILTINEITTMSSNNNIGKKNIIYNKNNINIKKIQDEKKSTNYILLSSKLDNGYLLYIRIPIASIEESVRISNNFLYLIGGITIVIAIMMLSLISNKFAKPILELNDIAKNISNLDFSKKYNIIEDSDDEINTLGKSINIMSDKLERVIKQLRSSNIQLERDIEEKFKIDEMRKQFISDVSHELKTPIALIQGYAEGLVENVNSDEENRQFYANVILDEANKMDKLVKQLLELMKLENGNRDFNNEKFDIVELINEVIKKYTFILKEQSIKVQLEIENPIYVMADRFYIEQVINNYFINAVKYAENINGEIKIIEISSYINLKNNKVRIGIFNTGKNIREEDIDRIWKRFYKIDESRNRDKGGTGIGLAIVKAIMNNYNNVYGIINKNNGVEFYFELNLID